MAWKIEVYTKDEGKYDIKDEETMKKAKKKIRSIFKKGLFIETEKHYSYYPPRVITHAEANKKES